MKTSNTPMRFGHLATVAAAQRLVIEHASYFSATSSLVIQARSQATNTDFEAGQEARLSARGSIPATGLSQRCSRAVT